ncbi:MAG: chloride channel protein, partial [Tidjanibacter sp.]|nr:chloride channel protein [Tidjanibacter sp.]
MRQTLLQRAQLWLSVQSRRINIRQLTFILAIIIGLVAGGVTCLFEWLLELIKHGLTSWFAVEQIGWLYLVYPAVGIILATIFVRFIIKDDISEGVTKVLKAMSTNSSAIKPHNCYSSVVGGALTIGFGGSVGPEAPIVLTGAAIGSNVGKIARLNYKQLTLLLCCGAGAAVAAIFKAPITGVVFVLEILMLDITSASVFPLILASVTATTTALIFRGFDPIFAINLSEADVFVIRQIPLYILLGVCCGLMSYYFTSVNSKVASFV